MDTLVLALVLRRALRLAHRTLLMQQHSLVGLVALITLAGTALAQQPEPAPAVAAPEASLALGSAGKDAKGFYLKGGDSSLYIGGFIQTRFSLNSRNDVADQDELTTGFSTRRARLGAQGDLNKQLSFKVEGDFIPDGFKLLDSFGRWTFSDTTRMRFGQFKTPLMKEDLISDTQQLLVERSVGTSTFLQDRSQGIDLQYADGNLRLTGAFTDGLKTLNTNFDSSSEADFGLTGRAEWKWAGEWKNFDGFTSFQGGKYAGYLGGAVHYQDGGETGGTADQSVLQYTLDSMAKGDGWNLFGAFVGRRTEPTTGEFDDFGFLVQGGYMVAAQWELAARYSLTMPDDSRVNGDDFSEVTLGVNHFILPESHAVKLSMDVTYCIDDQAGSNSIVRPSAANAFLAAPDDQIYARIQFQIVY
jgi:phosphate-selective porin